MSIITNKKIITTKDQSDLETLTKFMQDMAQAFKTANNKKKVIEVEQYFEEGDNYAYYYKPEGIDSEFIINFGAELVALDNSDIIEKNGTKFETVKYEFSGEELNSITSEMTTAVIEKEQLLAEKKKVVSGYTAREREFDAKISRLAQNNNSGFEMRERACIEVLDFSTNQKHYKDKETGKTLKTVEMLPADRQLLFNFDPS